MKNEDLSREVSYALRHSPHEYGICLDEDGWADLNDLLRALKEKRKLKKLELGDLQKLVCCQKEGNMSTYLRM